MGGYAAGTRRAAPAGGDGGVLGLGEEILLGVLELLELVLGDRVELLRRIVLHLGLPAGPGDDRRLELVDLARGVVERAGHVVTVRLGRVGSGGSRAAAPVPAPPRP